MLARILICICLGVAAAGSAPLLSIDFDCRSSAAPTNTQPGFSSFLITSNISVTSPQTNGTIRTFGTYRVTLTGNGLNRGYVDRSHALPTNNGAFTESQLLRDCVFSPDTTTNGGLNVQIENLPPSNRVQVTIWSFDEISPPARASDWYANGALMRHAYQFTNSVMPVRNDQYRFSFTTEVSGSGQLLIEGRRNPLSNDGRGVLHPGVYLNALQIDPEPLEILSVTTNGNELRITFVVRPQAGTYVIEETSGGAWTTANGVLYGTPTNNRVTARLPRPAQSRLYRIRYNY